MTGPPERDLSAGAASAAKVEARKWKAVIVISHHDNVATALEPLEPGALLDIAGRQITVLQRIPPGHKIALTRIPEGERVVKYGSAIGTALSEIPEGAHVHTHNVVSARGRGDLAPHTSGTEARLAEPDDLASPGASELPGQSAGRRQESADE